MNKPFNELLADYGAAMYELAETNMASPLWNGKCQAAVDAKQAVESEFNRVNTQLKEYQSAV